MSQAKTYAFLALAAVTMSLLTAGIAVGAASGAVSPPEPAVQDHARLTEPNCEDEFPAIGCDAEGRLWVAWVAWDGDTDRVLTRRADAEGPAVCVSGSAADCWRPAMARDGEERLWITWAQQQAGNWDLWACYLAEDTWGKPQRLTESPGSDFGQQLAVDARGQLWMVWQAVVEQNFEIFVARLTPQGLHDLQNASRHPANDWEPAIAADRKGGVWIGWDSYRTGNYDIFVCRLQDGQLSEPTAVTGAPDYEAHASLAVDHQDRLWVAWDSAGAGWGQHGDQRQRLHSRREVHLRCLQAGQAYQPTEVLMSVVPESMRRFVELPRLQIDGRGRLWVILRHLQDLTPAGTRKVGGKPAPQQSRGIWNPYAVCYTGRGWSGLAKLPDSNGRNDMRTAVCLDKAGDLWAAWAEDGRRPTRAEEPGNHEVHAARIVLAGASSGSPAVTAVDPGSTQPAAPPPPARPERHTATIGGIRYQLVFGDTHRHTDISRCAMNYDGSLMDTYRYAIDAAALDFLAISDHDQDLLKHRYGRQEQGPLQDYAWWRSQKYCDLFHIAGRFLPLYGYEHGGSYKDRGGHKNIIYVERGQPCFEEDSPEDLFRVLRGKQALAIPHQLADGGSATDWVKWNADFERVAEIFQARGSYEYFGCPRQAAIAREGHYLRDALDRDLHIGVIASSDHGLVHNAYAAVYVREFTRGGVLEALRQRRSYGATEKFILDFRSGESPLGSEVTTAGQPEFFVSVQAPRPLKLVEVVRDGQIVYSTRPAAVRCEFRFTDTDLPVGAKSHFYVRAAQDDDQWAWSSAIWVQRKARGP